MCRGALASMASRVSENLFPLSPRQNSMPIPVSCHLRTVCQFQSVVTSQKTLNINALFYCTVSTQVLRLFTVCTQALWLLAVSTEALWLFILSTAALDPVQPPIRLLPSARPPQSSHRSLSVTVQVCVSV